MAIRTSRSLCVLLAVLLTACGPRTTPDPTLSAVISEVQGEVSLRPDADSDYVAATNGMTLQIAGGVRTGETGRARLDLSTGTLIRVAPASLFTLVANEPAEGGLASRFRLEFGRVWIILKGGSADVETPSGVASVRGSYLMVEVLPDSGLEITCLEGECGLGNDLGSVVITAGQTALITNFNSAPLTGKMSDQDVLDWLAANPEATVVIPPLTVTVPPAAPPAGTPVPPTSTPLPTSGMAQVLVDSRCRFGPGTEYDTLTFLSAGQMITLIGVYGNWYLSDRPDGPGSCWVSDDVLQIDFPVGGLPQVEPPPPPAQAYLPPTAITIAGDLPVFQNVSGPSGDLNWCDTPVFSADVLDLDGVARVLLFYTNNYGAGILSEHVSVPGDGYHYQLAFQPQYIFITPYNYIEWHLVAFDVRGATTTSASWSYTLHDTCP